jgi:ribonuclease PH
MFEIYREELTHGGRRLVLETGRVARQADGAVWASWGDTTVLATVVAAKAPKPGQDFFPLTVHYQEKTYAAGRIPGGYLKREGRMSDRETLTSRLIDRPIRPLFPDGFRCDTQVIVTVLSHDMETDPDVLGLIASSAALTLSGVPFMGPVGAARVGVIGGEVKANPTIEEMKESTLDLVVAGTADAVLMVESEAKELSEETMLKAVMAGHASFQPVIAAIIRLAEKAAKEPRELALNDKSAVEKAVLAVAEADLRDAYSITHKQERYAAVDAVKAKVKAALLPEGGTPEFTPEAVAEALHDAQAEVVRWNILDHKRRIDGRDLTTVRPILAQVGVLPRTHGSACSPAAKPRRWWWRRSAPARTSSTSTAGRHLQAAVPAALQLPSLFGRRDRPHGRARPARNRPRQARLARHPSDAAEADGVPLHDPRRVGDHRVQRLVVDGDGVRLLAGADGRGRAAQAADRRHRHGPDPRRRPLRGAVRHPGRRGSPRRHGLQGGRHRSRRHLAADGHQDRRHHRRDHAVALDQAKDGRCTSWARWARR